ncbi:hypothetical protein LCL98_13375 [Rossellomorea aquimaris]|nr:hypothetical protein [Rossellomorea aquimaris]
MRLKKIADKVENYLIDNDKNIARLLDEEVIKFTVENTTPHSGLICKNSRTGEVIAQVLYDPFNKFLYTTNSLGELKNVMVPFEEGEEEIIEYFQHAISEAHELNYEDLSEKNKILFKLSDFASLLKEDRNKEQQRLEDLGPITWVSEEELVGTDIMDVPIKKETKTFIRLGYLENKKKYVLMESVKTIMDNEMMDVSQNVFEFHIDSVEVIAKLLKTVLGKDIRLS